LELASVPHKKDVIAKVGRVNSAEVLGLLAVVLRRQDPKRARWYVVHVLNLEGPTMASVIKNVPDYGADPGGASRPVETLDSDSRGLRRRDEISEVVGYA
jgi:hypothetical protein